MRILTNTFSFAPAGGVELNVFQVTRELARRGHQITVFSAGPGELEAEYERFGSATRTLGNFMHGPLSIPQLKSPGVQLAWLASLVPAVRAGQAIRPDTLYVNSTIGLP